MAEFQTSEVGAKPALMRLKLSTVSWLECIVVKYWISLLETNLEQQSVTRVAIVA
jgi:hypothetical protein